LEEGDVFYIKEPSKLKKSIGVFAKKEDKITLKITSNQLIITCGKTVFASRLYDPLIAEANDSFWKPERFDPIKKSVVIGFKVGAERVAELREGINNTSGDFVTYTNKEDEPSLLIGDKTQGFVDIDFYFGNGLDETSVFNKNLFQFIGTGGFHFGEALDHKLVVLYEQMGNTVKFCFIPKKIDNES
jgi:hypothetical protein